MRRIRLLRGVNLGRDGKRSAIYDPRPFAPFFEELLKTAEGRGVILDAFQSDFEGELIQKIHASQDEGIDGILINAGAWTHTSLALADALSDSNIPYVEVHLSNTKAREPFRAHSFLSAKALGVVEGFGLSSYQLALSGLISHLDSRTPQT